MIVKVTRQDYVIAPKASEPRGSEKVEFIEFQTFEELFQKVYDEWDDDCSMTLTEFEKSVREGTPLWGEWEPTTEEPISEDGYALDDHCIEFEIITQKEWNKIQEAKQKKAEAKAQNEKLKSDSEWDRIFNEIKGVVDSPSMTRGVIEDLKRYYVAPKKLKNVSK